jgi:uncharacterized protein YjbJ (UPF0337 family)
VASASRVLVWPRTCLSKFEGKMTNSTRQQIEGDLHDAKGTAKEAEGKLTHDPDLEADGRIEKVAGIVQKKLGKLEKLIGK